MDKQKAVESIVRAKVMLEGKSASRPHSDSCLVGNTGYDERCTCGADEANARRPRHDNVIAELDRALAALVS